jgi:transposase
MIGETAVDFLGIDIGKLQLHAALLQGERIARKSVSNNVTGFEQLVKWLSNREVQELHICLEATGSYGDSVAEYLHDQGHRVSVVNPMQTKSFGQSELIRTKTDKVDAGMIARFCRAMKPPAWNPGSAEIRAFRAMVRRRETLTQMIASEKNRLEAAIEPAVKRSISSTIAALRDELKRLASDIDGHLDANPDLGEMVKRLDELPGFGSLTAQKVIAETKGFSVCDTRQGIVAFAGMNPRQSQSGKRDLRGRITKIGNAALRKGLFFAAMAAKRSSPYFRAFVARLQAAGKRPKVIIVALMRKLLIVAFTLVSRKTRFNPAYAA